jgi:lysophospholipase L1-like esterase
MFKKIIFIVFCIVLLELGARFFLWFSLNQYVDDHIAAPYQARMRDFYDKVFLRSSHLPFSESKFDALCYTIPQDGMFFRGPESEVTKIPVHKPEDEIRIMCIGDSSTYGLFVDYEHSWPRLLEKKLKQYFPDKNIRVLNAGIPGATNRQVKRTFQLHLVDYSPDIVLSKIGLEVYDTYEVPEKGLFFKYWLWRLLYGSRLFRSICVLVDEYKEKTNTTNPEFDTKDAVYDFLIQRRSPRKEYVYEKEYKCGLSILERIATENGAQAFVGVDCLLVLPDGSLYTDYREGMMDKYVYTRPAFEKKMESMPSTDLFVDGGHLTELGTETIAEEVFAFLINDEESKRVFS